MYKKSAILKSITDFLKTHIFENLPIYILLIHIEVIYVSIIRALIYISPFPLLIFISLFGTMS